MFHFHRDEDYSINPVSARLKGLSDHRQYSAKPIKTPDLYGGDMENGDLADRLHARHAREHLELAALTEDPPALAETIWTEPPVVKVIRPAWKRPQARRSA